MILRTLILFSVMACSSGTLEGDRRLKKSDIPAFLKKYDSDKFDDVKFFEKSKKSRQYEVKYKKDGSEVSVAFDKDGNFVEKEEDTTLDKFPKEVREKIINHLNTNYSGYKILEVEKRKDESKDKFIDVEIRHHSSKSGYFEMTYDMKGEFISKEIEDYQTINTLN